MTVSPQSWWEEPIQHWSAALGFTYEVHHTTPVVHTSPVGQWWLDGDNWCLQVDNGLWLELLRFRGPEEVRSALSWTLRKLYRNTQKDWKQTAVEQLHEFMEASDHGLFEAWANPKHSVEFSQPTGQLAPGYFVWIQFESKGVKNPVVTDDVRTTIEEVIRAFSTAMLLGWTSRTSDGASLLIYCPVPSALDEWDDEVGAVPTDQVGRDMAIERKWLHGSIAQMLDMLAEDALVLATAFVGCRVSDYSAVQKGLLSTVISSRSKKYFARNARIMQWGEHPWIPLVQGVSAAAVEQFREVASLRAPERELHLNDELMETLEGLIAGNLNVSETARLLYLHRNTLNHRIERIRQQTGYDIRTFQDAFILWMVHVLR
jgi:hypothetical protein